MNAVIAGITVRSLLGRRRSLLLMLIPAAFIAITAIYRAADGPRPTHLLTVIGVGVLLPLVSLVVGTSVLGSEIDDGTAVHLLAEPIPRRSIVLTKLVVAIGVTIAFAVLPVGVAALVLVGNSDGIAAGFTLGTAVGAVVYCSMFLMLSLLTRRAIAFGLLYVLAWESALGNFVGGTRLLSVQQYVRSIARAVAGSTDLTAHLAARTSLILAIVFTVASTWLAVRRLRSFSLVSEVA